MKYHYSNGNCVLCRAKAVTTLLVLVMLSTCHTSNAGMLTLEDALGIAMENSPDIRRARYSLQNSRYNLKAQQSSLKSQFSLSLTPFSYRKESSFNQLVSSYIDQKRKLSSARLTVMQPLKWTDGTISLANDFSWQEASSEFTGNVTERQYVNSLYLNFNQPFFTYNRTQLALQELELALEYSELYYAVRRLELERQVTQQFFDVYYRRMSVDIEREAYGNSEEGYQIIKKKVEAGIAAQEEFYQAELTLSNSRAALENSEVTYANTVDQLKILLGLSLYDTVDVAADVRKQIIPVGLELAVAKGLENRMELRQRAIDIETAEASLIRAGAENEFKASIDLTFGWTGVDDKFADIYESPARNEEVSLSVNIPLWDWGRKKARLAAAETAVKSAELDHNELEKNVVLDIRQAYRNLRNQETQIEIAEQNVRNAQLTYEINLERYRTGDISSKDLGDYLSQLSRERIDQIAALINYRLALLNLKIESLWDFENNRPVLEVE